MKFKIITTAVLALLLVSCDKPTEIKKTHDVTDQYVDIRVMTFESRTQLNKFLELKNVLRSRSRGSRSLGASKG